MGPGDLARALCGVPLSDDPNVLVGLGCPDDAGIFRLNDDVALVQTVDYFTPIVDDPFTFGRIAAANALSDVWAMGGRPVCAMNIVCFPADLLELEVLQETLKGGAEALKEAGAALVGGHSVEAPEFKYGLSVTGVVHPEHFLTAGGAKPGDALVLTKPLGTGIIATALKANAASEESTAAATENMVMLNRKAAEAMLEHQPSACTDVTGFSLLGHAFEMVQGSQVGLEIRASDAAVLPGVEDLAEMGFLPAGLHRNREFYQSGINVGGAVERWLADVLYDPQTSGGLLIALAEGSAAALVEELRASGHNQAAAIGRFVEERPGRIVVED